MNHSMYSADRATHLKVVVVALFAATALLLGSIAANVDGYDTSSQTASATKVHGPVVKASPTVVITSNANSLTR
jgi:hypothetical protein